MYERKIQEDLDCGIVIAMKVFCAKWKPCIIDAIARGHNRPSEIHKQIPEAAPRVLDIQLRELLKLGVVSRDASSGFPLKSLYTLTELGKSVVPIILQLDKWGTTYKTEVKSVLMEPFRMN